MSGPVTHIATADATSVTIRGRDLVNDLIGKLTFTEMFYLLITGRPAEPAQTRVLDACLVTLMEHGFTPSALVARLMAESSPGQIQTSIAAGLLAVGDVHAGTMEGCAALLVEGVDQADADAWCRALVTSCRQRREAVPGFGHKMHKPDDPRTPPLLRVARENGLDGRYVQLLLRLSSVIDEMAGRHVTINATGALAALLLEIGIAPAIVRAIAVVSRSGGLVGHILEEQQTSSARHLVKAARETIPYRDPPV
ncbi:MAG: citryl-CoA lyase [Beijerinckiaceae bacterium]|jgi:citrate synthase|nr:citryl-CoA lyase [Beijerinckiaceae bacterium]MDO9441942.1 citryl-CoA lyase [Beijerinckiaceae bacterium]